MIWCIAVDDFASLSHLSFIHREAETRFQILNYFIINSGLTSRTENLRRPFYNVLSTLAKMVARCYVTLTSLKIQLSCCILHLWPSGPLSVFTFSRKLFHSLSDFSIIVILVVSCPMSAILLRLTSSRTQGSCSLAHSILFTVFDKNGISTNSLRTYSDRLRLCQLT